MCEEHEQWRSKRHMRGNRCRPKMMCQCQPMLEDQDGGLLGWCRLCGEWGHRAASCTQLAQQHLQPEPKRALVQARASPEVAIPPQTEAARVAQRAKEAGVDLRTLLGPEHSEQPGPSAAPAPRSPSPHPSAGTVQRPTLRSPSLPPRLQRASSKRLEADWADWRQARGQVPVPPLASPPSSVVARAERARVLSSRRLEGRSARASSSASRALKQRRVAAGDAAVQPAEAAQKLAEPRAERQETQEEQARKDRQDRKARKKKKKEKKDRSSRDEDYKELEVAARMRGLSDVSVAASSRGSAASRSRARNKLRQLRDQVKIAKLQAELRELRKQ